MGVQKWLILVAFLAAQLRWMPSDSPGITEYRVYRAAKFTSEWQLIGITPSDNPTYRLRLNGWYSVTAVDYRGQESNGCESVYFKKSQYKTPKGPKTPEGLKVQ